MFPPPSLPGVIGDLRGIVPMPPNVPGVIVEGAPKNGVCGTGSGWVGDGNARWDG